MRSKGWLAALAIVATGACTDGSGCLSTEPLPVGGLPATQTIEGGAQIRITRQGFNKLTSVVPDLINAQLTDGLCVPEGTQATVNYCYEDQGPCTNGCQVNLALNQTQFVATNSYTLTLRLDLAANATIPADASGFDPCYLYANGDHLYGDADIELVPDPTTGQLTVTVARIRNLDLSRLDITGSSGFCSGASAFADFLKSYFEQEIADYITPRVNELIASYLPDPLGIEGVLGLGAGLEARVIPGGFATVFGNSQLQITGATLGVITGFNSDRDRTTRNGSAASEPDLCVPPLLAPPLDQPPYSLGQTARDTFLLPAAPGFSGSPDPLARDLSIGISERMLDLAGHHAVTSGAVCLGLGTSTIAQLNLGTFGILVPSVADLGSEDGNDPMLIVTRPQKAIDFSIGDNTASSPALTVHIRDLQLDIYAFLYERYTRVFTITATLDAGIGIALEQSPDTGLWQAKPTLVGVTSSDVTVTVSNNDFVAESKAQLENALPSVFDLLVSQLDLPAFELPTFAGFAIGAPSITRVTAAGSEFLAVNANLDVVAPAAGRKLVARATLAGVDTPPIESVRAGAPTTVVFDADAVDDLGRALEWSWRIGNGLWRPYRAASPLEISDRAFAFQGAYTIGLMARLRDEPGVTSAEQTFAVVIDSAGPRLVSESSWDGDRFTVRGWDVVDGSAIRIAFGRPGDTEPRTAWQAGGTATLSRAEVAELGDTGDIAVFLDDATGNRTVATVLPFHGTSGESGCSCDTRGAGTSTLGLAIVTWLGVLRSSRGRHRRRRRR